MLAQIRQFWSNLTPLAKALYGGIAGVMAIVIAGVGYWSTQTNYAVMYSGLAPEVSAQIVKKLDADRVSYRLENDGTTILVPNDKMLKTKMNLAVDGLPSGGSSKGYELFDSMSMGTTPFVQGVTLNRAKEGEIAKTIKALEPIADARVHIVQPEQSTFIRDEKPVTASIYVKTKPGMTLSRQAIAGIQVIAANGLKGLTTDNVSVINSEGTVLSEKRDQQGNLASTDQMAYQLETERRLATKAQEMLNTLLGHGRAIVRVSTEMSFRHVKEVSEKYDPDGKVALHETESTTKSTGPTGPRGPTGMVPNLPPAADAPATPAVGGPTLNDEKTERDYAVSRVNLSKEEKQGLIDRLTVAVLLFLPKGAGEDAEQAIGINQDEIRELMKVAVGFRDDRDKIQVSIGKAPGEPNTAEAVASNDVPIAAVPKLFGQDYATVVRGSALAVAGLIALAMLVKFFRRGKSSKSSPATAPAFAGLPTDPRSVPEELNDLHAVAATIKAWLEEPNVVRFEQNGIGSTPQARPA